MIYKHHLGAHGWYVIRLLFPIDVVEKMATLPSDMSFTQIIEEIPLLTRAQRREVALRLLEMEATEAEAEDIALCEHSAAMGFALLDAMEAEDHAP